MHMYFRRRQTNKQTGYKQDIFNGRVVNQVTKHWIQMYLGSEQYC